MKQKEEGEERNHGLLCQGNKEKRTYSSWRRRTEEERLWIKKQQGKGGKKEGNSTFIIDRTGALDINEGLIGKKEPILKLAWTLHNE